MIGQDRRRAIVLLHERGMSLRDIARRLEVSRNTVREIVEQGGEMPVLVRRDKVQIDEELLRRLYAECNGYAQRVYEKLVEEEGLQVTYSTLTRLLRALEISKRPEARCDRVPDQPGGEMQHDTSPYEVKLAGQRVKVIASLLYLRYSKRRYLKFYRVFNRFLMKCFFHEALMAWGYAAGTCIIDNTNLARLRGIGKNAVIVPEMERFGRQYGFTFVCHEKGHADRKAGEERSFFTVETNFFPGRSFQNMVDLNTQALGWSTVKMEHRPQGKAKLIPAVAFAHERQYLVELLPCLPAPYREHQRRTDQYGYAAFDGNYYWVPGSDRRDVKLLEYSDRLQIYVPDQERVEYRLPQDGSKNQRFSPDGYPRPRHRPKSHTRPTAQEEARLRTMAPAVAAYLDFALKPKGIERHRLIRQLFALSQKMSAELFASSLERAHKFKITRSETIERIAIQLMNQMITASPVVVVDDEYRERDTYREGYLTDPPDLSRYQCEEDSDG